MSLNLKALALAAGVLWGGMFFFVGLANLIWPSYGGALLDLGASIYPGYNGPSGFGSLIVVTLYGVADGVTAGVLFGWLYNVFAVRRPRTGYDG